MCTQSPQICNFVFTQIMTSPDLSMTYADLESESRFVEKKIIRWNIHPLDDGKNSRLINTNSDSFRALISDPTDRLHFDLYSYKEIEVFGSAFLPFENEHIPPYNWWDKPTEFNLASIMHRWVGNITREATLLRIRKNELLGITPIVEDSEEQKKFEDFVRRKSKFLILHNKLTNEEMLTFLDMPVEIFHWALDSEIAFDAIRIY